MSAFGAYLRACHPEPTLAVTALATALAVTAGQGAGAAAVPFAALAGQLSVGWSNDWLDAERDRVTARPDKPVVRGELAPGDLRRAALLAAAAAVPLSLLMGLRAGLVHLVAVAGAWAYNARLKSTPLSFLPYAVAFGALPSIITLALPGHPLAPGWATATGALLGTGAHLANVLPDLEGDLATGVRGLPHRLGGRASGLLSAGLLLAATAALVFGPGSPGPARWAALAVAAAVVVAGQLLARGPGSRAPFRAVLVVAVVDVALLLASGSSLAPT